MEEYGNKEIVDTLVNNLREFGFDLPNDILALAIKKCNLNLEEALLLLTEED